MRHKVALGKFLKLSIDLKDSEAEAGLDKMVADVQGELRDSSKIGGVEVCVLAAEEMGVEIVIHDIRSHGNLGHSSTRLGDGAASCQLHVIFTRKHYDVIVSGKDGRCVIERDSEQACLALVEKPRLA